MKYHDYIFNLKKRKYIGDFEKMYKDEEEGNFDSWFATDITVIQKKISIDLINCYNFNKIIDIGCGKGAFSNLLKKNNNTVYGIDVSETAINEAKRLYGHKINFHHIKDNKFENFIANKVGSLDLTVTMEVLSYIEEWKKMIEIISNFSSYFYITLYIPDNPIGFVKSHDELLKVFSKYFNVQQKIIYMDYNIFLLGKNKKEIK